MIKYKQIINLIMDKYELLATGVACPMADGFLD